MNIDTLSKMDDAELSAKLGLNAKLEDAKKAIAEMQELEGDERKYAEERIQKMFEPNVWPEDFKYIVEDAKCRSKSPEVQKDNCCCGSVL